MRRIITAITATITLAVLTQPAAAAPPPARTVAEVPAEVRAAHSDEVLEAFIAAYWRNVWIDAYWARIVAFTNAYAAAHATPAVSCGGDLPPCWVLHRESRGDARIWNGGCYAPVGWFGRSPCGTSSASGRWQIVRGTWARHRGYLNAADAPAWVQDERARQLWAGGRGCAHWSAC